MEGCEKAITSIMDEQYAKPRRFTTKTKGAQEAHEAIRPTYMEDQLMDGTVQEKKLYDLIWKRTIASQMADAELEWTTVIIGIDNDTDDKFTAIGEVIKFDGFLHVYKESYDDEQEQENENQLLPPLNKGQSLDHKEIVAVERFTQRPARYTEAGLVRKLEELGIGRPSTYAPTISTIQQRGYVEKGDREGEERIYKILTLKKNKITDTTQTEKTGSEKAKLFPTDIGIVVNDFLTTYFPNILDYNFTANVEKEFDDIAEGEKQWTTLMKDFYANFHPSVETTLATKSEHKVGERILGTEPETGKPVSVKIGRFGPVIQIGTADDEEKPRFSQLKKGLSLETITLEEALDVFKLPRTLGEFENEVVIAGIGPFGPYIKHNAKYASIPKDIDPLIISLEDAINLINHKREAEAQKLLKTFAEDPKLQILNGKYGPYITYKGKNYKIPKNIVPKDLELQAVMEIINKQDEKGTTPKRGRYTAKKK
jgi:DNA topoisomerase-1